MIDEEALAEAQELSAFSATLGPEDRIRFVQTSLTCDAEIRVRQKKRNKITVRAAAKLLMNKKDEEVDYGDKDNILAATSRVYKPVPKS